MHNGRDKKQRLKQASKINNDRVKGIIFGEYGIIEKGITYFLDGRNIWRIDEKSD